MVSSASDMDPNSHDALGTNGPSNPRLHIQPEMIPWIDIMKIYRIKFRAKDNAFRSVDREHWQLQTATISGREAITRFVGNTPNLREVPVWFDVGEPCDSPEDADNKKGMFENLNL